MSGTVLSDFCERIVYPCKASITWKGKRNASMSIMSKLFCHDDIGIDLGAANMRVWVGGEGLVLEEPAAVALDITHEEVKEQGQQESKDSGKPREHRVLAIGVLDREDVL